MTRTTSGHSSAGGASPAECEAGDAAGVRDAAGVHKPVRVRTTVRTRHRPVGRRGAGPRTDLPTTGVPPSALPTTALPTTGVPPSALPSAGLPDVARAMAALDGVARRTRVVASGPLSADLGLPVLLKCENEQHTGSFKLRGAYVRIAAADPAARARGVVAASAGNHAQGVAYAAATFDTKATIFVPEGANPLKVARTRRWGARVEHVPGRVDAALAAAQSYAAETGRLFVHPFDDRTVVAGQGTVGYELLEQVSDLETVLVGVGGGGLLTGVAAALRPRRPGVRVVGVQAASAPAFATSLRTGRLVTAAAATVADGLAVGRPGTVTLDLARRLGVDDVVTVDEEAFWEAMALLWADGHRVEPAGAAGVAALLRHPELAHGTTAVVLSGGNLDVETARRVAELASAGGCPA